MKQLNYVKPYKPLNFPLHFSKKLVQTYTQVHTVAEIFQEKLALNAHKS